MQHTDSPSGKSSELCAVQKVRPSRLVNSDANGFVLLGLGNRDGEDAVVKRGTDCVLVDTTGEAEAPRELANRALRDPVLFGRRLWLLLGVRCAWALGDLLVVLVVGAGSSGGNRALVLVDVVFNGSMVRSRAMRLALFGEDASNLCRRGAGGVVALNTAPDHNGLRVGELDLNVVTINAGELAVQLVCLLGFADIELGTESAGGLSMTTAAGLRGAALNLATVGVKVIEEAEEVGEAGVRAVGAVDTTREERHFGFRCVERVVKRFCAFAECSRWR